MKSIILISILLSLVGVIHGRELLFTENAKNFDGYQVLRIKVETKDGLKLVEKLSDSFPSVDYWNDPEVGKYADVMVSPSDLPKVIEHLNDEELKWSVFIADVGSIIKAQAYAEQDDEKELSKKDVATADEFWTQYQRLDAIFSWMEALESQYPFVSTQTIGYTYEQRPLRLLKIAKGNSTSRPSVFLDSGIHAREWISPATLTFIINRLITDPQYADILDALDIHALPVLNPDGYEYTHTVNRMWRKNRKPNAGSNCFGTDLNRNFPYQWCTVGASNDSCNEAYCGSGPASEVETQSLIVYLLNPINWWGYVTLHSYAQEWCIPWAYTSTHAPDYDDMWAVGRKAVDALELTHGTPYVLKIPSGRYGGFSMDWAKGVRNIKYPVLIELRDMGRYGFVLPPEQIIPSGEETLAAIVVYLREIATEAAGEEYKNV